jgi:hypothetical protein
MDQMKVYLSGKITGLPESRARAQFRKAQLKMLQIGFEVVNPLTIEHNHDKTWESYMRTDIAAMMQCDAIYMLPGWDISRGAKLEYNLAKELNFHFIF